MLDNPNDPLRHPFGPRELAEIADSLAALPCGHVEDPLPLLTPEFIQIGSGGSTYVCSTTKPVGPIPCGTHFTVFMSDTDACVYLHRLPRDYERALSEAQWDQLFDFLAIEFDWTATVKEAPDTLEMRMEIVSEVLEDRIAEMTEAAAR